VHWLIQLISDHQVNNDHVIDPFVLSNKATELIEGSTLEAVLRRVVSVRLLRLNQVKRCKTLTRCGELVAALFVGRVHEVLAQLLWVCEHFAEDFAEEGLLLVPEVNAHGIVV